MRRGRTILYPGTHLEGGGWRGMLVISGEQPGTKQELWLVVKPRLDPDGKRRLLIVEAKKLRLLRE
jgi:hypothetical protein